MNTIRLVIIALYVVPVSIRAEITENDLFLFGELIKYKTEVVQMLNKLASEHPSCKKRISAATAGVSKERSTPDNPSFFVQCGDRDIPEVVRFTLKDIKTMRIPNAAKNIERDKGLEICRKEAKRRALIPSSVDFSTFFNVAYDPKPNGNTVISSVFTSKNIYNATLKYRIFCFFNGQQVLTDVSVKPYQ